MSRTPHRRYYYAVSPWFRPECGQGDGTYGAIAFARTEARAQEYLFRIDVGPEFAVAGDIHLHAWTEKPNTLLTGREWIGKVNGATGGCVGYKVRDNHKYLYLTGDNGKALRFWLNSTHIIVTGEGVL